MKKNNQHWRNFPKSKGGTPIGVLPADDFKPIKTRDPFDKPTKKSGIGRIEKSPFPDTVKKK